MKSLTLLFFCIVWLPLMLCMQLQYPIDHTAIRKSLDGNATRMLADNQSVRNYLINESAIPYKKERVGPYATKASIVVDAIAGYFAYMNAWKQKLDGKTNREVHALLAGPCGEIAVVREWDRMIHLFQQNTPPRFIEALKRDLPQPFSALDDGGPVHKSIFESTSSEEAINMILAIRNDMLWIGQEALQEIQRETYVMDGDGCFSSTFTVGIPHNSFVLPGQSLAATIMTAALDKHHLHVVHSPYAVAKKEQGIMTLRWKARGLGRQTITGTISAVIDTYTITKPWSVEYFVGPRYAELHFKKSTVFRQIANPLTLHADGYDEANIRLLVPHATILKAKAGSYEVSPTANAPAKMFAFLTFTGKQGKVDTISGLELTVKDLPVPTLSIGGKPAADLTIADFKASPYLTIQSRDPDFDVPYVILSYKVSLISQKDGESAPFNITGNNYGGLTQLLKNATVGDHVVFADILVRGNAAKSMLLPAFTVLLH